MEKRSHPCCDEEYGKREENITQSNALPEESTRSDLPEGWLTDSWLAGLVRSVFFYWTEQDHGLPCPVVKKTREESTVPVRTTRVRDKSN